MENRDFENRYENDYQGNRRESSETTGSGPAGLASQVKNQVVDAAHAAKDRIRQAGQDMEHKMDETRQRAAGSLEQTASRIQETGPKISRVTEGAAGKLNATADYLRGHDVGAMMTDVENVVRRYPAESLAVAAAAGFLMARMLRRAA